MLVKLLLPLLFLNNAGSIPNCMMVPDFEPIELPIPSGCANGEDYCEEDSSYPNPDLIRKLIRSKSTELELSLLFQKTRLIPPNTTTRSTSTTTTTTTTTTATTTTTTTTTTTSTTITTTTTTTTTPTTTTSKSTTICEKGWTQNPVTGSCYKVLEEKLNWEEASRACSSLGEKAELATTRSCQEYKFLKELLIQNNRYSRYWLGGNDIATEGSWTWTDGSPVIYSGWHVDEPNDFQNNGGEDCLLWGWKKNELEVKWNDVPCKSKHFGLCKIPDNVGELMHQQSGDYIENSIDCEDTQDGRYTPEDKQVFYVVELYPPEESAPEAPLPAKGYLPEDSEQNVCTAFESIMYPKLAKNENGEWRYIINIDGDDNIEDNYLQAVKFERCNNEDKPCEIRRDSVCRQKYTETILVAISNDSKPYLDFFRFPSCCVCYLKEYLYDYEIDDDYYNY